jgi:hypothetical protein
LKLCNPISELVLWPLFSPLFTRVRGRGILGRSYAGYCIDPPPRVARLAREGLRAVCAGLSILWRGWICSEANELVPVLSAQDVTVPDRGHAP